YALPGRDGAVAEPAPRAPQPAAARHAVRGPRQLRAHAVGARRHGLEPRAALGVARPAAGGAAAALVRRQAPRPEARPSALLDRAPAPGRGLADGLPPRRGHALGRPALLEQLLDHAAADRGHGQRRLPGGPAAGAARQRKAPPQVAGALGAAADRKSTRLNSSHVKSSY